MELAGPLGDEAHREVARRLLLPPPAAYLLVAARLAAEALLVRVWVRVS